MSDLVSILIPAFNVQAWLGTTIRSALAQTWPRIELIVVDDGSTDATLTIAKSFESGRVKVVTQVNQGACAARNHALSLAQGTYIQWLDADDILHPHKIDRQMRRAHELSDRRMLLSGAFGTFYYRLKKAEFRRTSLWRDLSPVDYFLTRFNDNVYFQTDVWLVSRDLTAAAGPWTDSDSPDDDGEYFCRVAMHSGGVKFVEDARTYYRIGNLGSVNNARSHRALTALYESKAKCIGYLLSLENSNRTRAVCIQLLQDWIPEFYPHRQDLITRAERLAKDLGGELRRPTLSWKYRTVERLWGYDAAVSASRLLPRLRAQGARYWDGLLANRLTRDSHGSTATSAR